MHSKRISNAKFALIVLILLLGSFPVQVWSAEKLSCTIEKSLTTGDLLVKQMVSTENYQ
jgi:hypothetical protein